MAIIDELLVGLGFEFDEKDLDSFQKSVDRSKAILSKFIKVTFAASAAVGTLLKTSATATDEITKQARQVNILTGEYDALLHASEITTGNSQNMASALQNLSVRASEAARGVGSGIEAFGILGVSVTDTNGELKSTDVLLSETADALNNLGDQGQRLELADKLGIREIDLLLRDGSEGIRKLTNEAKALGTITEADSKAAEAFNDAQARMLRALNTVRRMIATGVLPQLQEVVDSFTEWLKVNKKIIKQKFDKFIKILAKVLSALGKIFSFILDLTGRFIDVVGGLDNALKLLVITFGAIVAMRIGAMFITFINLMRTAGTAALVMNAKMLLIPILIGAAIAALGLLIDDILTFINGGDSLFGKMLKDFPMVTKSFEFLKNLLNDILVFFEDIGNAIGEFTFDSVVKIKQVIDNPLGTVEGALDSAGEFLSGFNPFSSSPPASAGATINNKNNSNKNTVKQTNTIIIKSDSPKEAGQEVKKVMEEFISNGIRNTTSTVDM